MINSQFLVMINLYNTNKTFSTESQQELMGNRFVELGEILLQTPNFKKEGRGGGCSLHYLGVKKSHFGLS